jgi:hypothetical protein
MHVHDAEGTVEDGKIRWKIKRQRAWTSPGKPHSGVVKEGKMKLIYEAIGPTGVKESGTTELTLEEKKP